MIIYFRIPSESPNIRKISIMLEETGLPYVVKMVEPHLEAPADAELAKISPTGTVPAIIDTDTGTALFESGAILFYLAEKSGVLLPSNINDKSEVVKWLMFEAANICPAMIELHHYIMNDIVDIPDTVFDRYKSKLADYCVILNKQLENRDYLCGEYSIADVVLYPWTAALEDMAEISLEDYPFLNHWAKTINRRPTTQQTASPPTNWCYRNGEVALCSA